MYKPETIISGGQYGADLMALKAAHICYIKTSGTAPRGWRVQLPDGTDSCNPDLANYGLSEHSSSEYSPRTIKNVEDGDATVWFGYKKSSGGKLTLSTCDSLNKPYLINPSPDLLKDWCEYHKVKVLNVAGNRESHHNPNICKVTFSTIYEAFKDKTPYIGSVYKHYKTDDCYAVKNFATRESNLEKEVIYQSIKTREIWVRPITEFMELIELQKNEYILRFTKLVTYLPKN